MSDYLVHLVFVKQPRSNYLIAAPNPLEAALEAERRHFPLTMNILDNPRYPKPVGIVVFGAWKETEKGSADYYRVMHDGLLKPCNKEELNEFLVQDENWADLEEKNGNDQDQDE